MLFEFLHSKIHRATITDSNLEYVGSITIDEEFLENKDIHYRLINIANKESEESLIKIGGKRQVPFLVDNERNVQMYESDDIIEYLKTIA